MRVPPPDTTVQCYIVRKKGAMGMFASYKLYLQENVTAGPGHMVTLRPPESVSILRFAFCATDADGLSPWVQNNPFLLSARKRKKQKKSNYLISLDEEDLAKNSGNYYGKVKSNFVGTEFVMHDKGVKPADAEQTPVANLRKELGCVLYAMLCSAVLFDFLTFVRCLDTKKYSLSISFPWLFVAGMTRMCWARKARAR